MIYSKGYIYSPITLPIFSQTKSKHQKQNYFTIFAFSLKAFPRKTKERKCLR